MCTFLSWHAECLSPSNDTDFYSLSSADLICVSRSHIVHPAVRRPFLWTAVSLSMSLLLSCCQSRCQHLLRVDVELCRVVSSRREERDSFSLGKHWHPKIYSSLLEWSVSLLFRLLCLVSPNSLSFSLHSIFISNSILSCRGAFSSSSDLSFTSSQMDYGLCCVWDESATSEWYFSSLTHLLLKRLPNVLRVEKHNVHGRYNVHTCPKILFCHSLDLLWHLHNTSEGNRGEMVFELDRQSPSCSEIVCLPAKTDGERERLTLIWFVFPFADPFQVRGIY